MRERAAPLPGDSGECGSAGAMSGVAPAVRTRGTYNVDFDDTPPEDLDWEDER